MIRRFDEVLCEKASKFAVTQLYKGKLLCSLVLDLQIYTKEEKFSGFKKEYETNNSQTDQRLKNLKLELDNLHIELSEELSRKFL